MNDHEKEKRGKIAELMYELLDFGRLEQLARDIWDRAPTNVKDEVAKLFAERVKAQIEHHVEWAEPKKDRFGTIEPRSPKKPMLQEAIERVIAEQVQAWLEVNGAQLRSDLQEKISVAVRARFDKEVEVMASEIIRKVRNGVDKGLRDY